LKTVATYFLFALAIVLSGCKPKEKESATLNKVAPPEEKLIAGQIFIVTKGGENIPLGDVEVALFDQQQMWTCFDSHALKWSNSLAEAQAKVDQATTNYDALYKDDITKFTTAKKYHDNIMQTAATGTPEWAQAFEWSTKLEKKIADLNEKKKLSDVGKQLRDAIFERDFQWNYINWPAIINLLASDLTTIQTTTTDAEGRFKLTVPPSSPNVVLFAKAEREVGDEKENYWWLVVVGTPVGSEATNLLWTMKKSPFWCPSVDLKDKVTEVILSNDNKSKGGVWYYLEDTNAANFIGDIGVKVEVAKQNAN
jgi:hypothetical protein